jgi:hypothetical protein
MTILNWLSENADSSAMPDISTMSLALGIEPEVLRDALDWLKVRGYVRLYEVFGGDASIEITSRGCVEASRYR